MACGKQYIKYTFRNIQIHLIYIHVDTYMCTHYTLVCLYIGMFIYWYSPLPIHKKTWSNGNNTLILEVSWGPQGLGGHHTYRLLNGKLHRASAC